MPEGVYSYRPTPEGSGFFHPNYKLWGRIDELSKELSQNSALPLLNSTIAWVWNNSSHEVTILLIGLQKAEKKKEGADFT